jgi:hypothetical protein
MRFRLRTLLIVLGIAPPVLAVMWFAGSCLRVQERVLVGVSVVPIFVLAYAFALYWIVAAREGH